jgi:hypothetical protein
MKAYFSQLVDATKNGVMSWVEVNPSTYSWDTRTPVPARLTLQLVLRQQVPTREPNGQLVVRQVKSYFFQAIEVQQVAQKVRLSVNGAEDDELNGLLETLYETIQSTISKQSLDFLKSILPPQKTN